MSPFAISEDLRGVLEDVVKEPKQRLFAGTCLQQAARGFDEIGDLTLTTRTGLSSAERHLLRVHKEELARALLFGFYYSFFAEGGPGQALNPLIPDPKQPRWKDHAEFARNNALPEAFAPGSARWLHRLLRGRPPQTFLEYHELAVAAERLTGTPTGRLYQGLNFDRAGKVGSAKSAFSQVCRYGSDMDRRTALQQLSTLEVNSDMYMSGFGFELQALSLAYSLPNYPELGNHIARALVLANLNPDPDLHEANLLSLAKDCPSAVRGSLTVIAETHGSTTKWHGITCGILDRFEAAV